jgi:all-trans-retinol 13,14-reductase
MNVVMSMFCYQSWLRRRRRRRQIKQNVQGNRANGSAQNNNSSTQPVPTFSKEKAKEKQSFCDGDTTSAVRAAPSTGALKRAMRRQFRLSDIHNKISNEFDVVIVGGGVSGLATASLLSQRHPEWSIVVLEQNEVVGGGLHTFAVAGETFHSGLHYIGNDADALRVMNMVCGVDEVKMKYCANGLYDRLVVTDIDEPQQGIGHELVIDMFAGQWVESYLHHFPLYKEEINCFYDSMKRLHRHKDQIQVFYRLQAVQCLSPGLRKLLQRWLCPVFVDMASVTVEQELVRCGITVPSLLARALCCQSGDYASDPSETSFVLHAMIILHYENGSFYPVDDMAMLMTRQILGANEDNQIYASTKVTGIIHDNEVLVEPSDNPHQKKPVVLKARMAVVVSCGPRLTQQLVMKNTTLTYAFVFLSLAEDVYVHEYNTWVNDTLFISIRDPRAVVIIVKSDASEWARWQNLTHKQRQNDEDYMAKKEMVYEHVMEKAKPHLPHRLVIKCHDVATPLTSLHHLGRPHMLGRAPTPYNMLNPVLPHHHDKLYMTGQDTLSPGIAGAMFSAELVSNVICGYGDLCYQLRRLFQGDLVKDLMAMKKKV